MSKRILTTQTMLAISERWLDPEKDKPILLRYPLTAAIFSHLLKAHTNLVVFQRASTESQEAISAVQKEQAALDAEHDRKIRGVYAILTGLAEIAETPARARHYLDIRDKLLPEGLRAVSRSYVDQAGEIEMLKGRLDEKTLLAIADINTPEGPLHLHVQAWMKAATLMSNLESKRMDLSDSASEDTRKSDVQRARNEWIRVVNGLRANLLLDEASPEDMHRVFRHLDAAEAKAERRAPEPVAPVGTPPPPDEAPPPCAVVATVSEAEIEPPASSG